jgi:hypothetical protein
MDTLARLGDQLLRLVKDLKPGEFIIIWKSDVSEAYRLLPVAMPWQTKQINFIEGFHHVDRCVAFGGRRSGDLYIAFMSLILWIAQEKRKVRKPNGFMDDVYSIQIAGQESFHLTLQKSVPTDQAKMLNLWDDLGIPYKAHKQQHGRVLTVLGIEVNTDKLTFTLPDEKREELIRELGRFIFDKQHRAPRRPLKDFQTLAGWLNWSFNVFPLLWHSLSNVYAKLRGLTKPNQRVTVSRAISNDLAWARGHIANSSGVYLLKANDWDPSLADLTIYTDACLTGMGFYLPKEKIGYQAKVPIDVPTDGIFYREHWAVYSALHYATVKLEMKNQKITIFTDNLNSVDIYNTLHALPTYNDLLKASVDLLLSSNCQLRVLHVPGEENTIANALSRDDADRAYLFQSDLVILHFEPPRVTLGAAAN